jgi:hypothetical protein
MRDHPHILRHSEQSALAAARCFVDRHAEAVSAAMARLERDLSEAHPGGWIYTYRYTPDAIIRNRAARPTYMGQPMGFVQMYALNGASYSGTVYVRQDGEVVTVINSPVPAPG